MPEPTDQPAQRPRSLTGFYVAMSIVVVLALFGFWFWRTWTVWWFDADEAKRRQAAAAQQLSLPIEKSVDLGGGVKLDLVLIPAGRFQMGKGSLDESGWDTGEGLHWVVITRPFYIGKYEVTQEQWEKVMGSPRGRFEGARNPVECISWVNCTEFVGALNDQKNLWKEKYQFRLPTEAEWEWACRAGTRTSFFCGNAEETLHDYAWFDNCTLGSGTHPVGSKKPNAWGLYDVHGNVDEWCWDWYDEYYYAKSPRCDPIGPDTGWGRVMRGGAYGNYSRDCRSSSRRVGEQTAGNETNGFRVVQAYEFP